MLKLIRKILGTKSRQPVQLRQRLSVPTRLISDIFAIGDIHGRLDLLLAAEERILAALPDAGPNPVIICVGDFIDRGPDSRGVLDHLISPPPEPLVRICICGNHDDAFLEFLRDDRFDPAWLGFGGDRTLLSYGLQAGHLLTMDPTGQSLKSAARSAVPSQHMAFLERLPVAVEVGSYLFVHAGVLPGLPLEDQADIDLMWIREPFLTQGPRTEITVVHGHTPSTTIQYGPGRIGIDTGAYATGVLKVLHIGPHGVSEL